MLFPGKCRNYLFQATEFLKCLLVIRILERHVILKYGITVFAQFSLCLSLHFIRSPFIYPRCDFIRMPEPLGYKGQRNTCKVQVHCTGSAPKVWVLMRNLRIDVSCGSLIFFQELRHCRRPLSAAIRAILNGQF